MVEHSDPMEDLRARVAEQRRTVRATRLRSKEMRARASATADRARAILLWAKGGLPEAEPPVPTHLPDDV